MHCTIDYTYHLYREIEKFKRHETNILQFQEEYKHKVGLSGHTKNNLPFHPNALKTELDDLKVQLNLCVLVSMF